MRRIPALDAFVLCVLVTASSSSIAAPITAHPIPKFITRIVVLVGYPIPARQLHQSRISVLIKAGSKPVPVTHAVVNIDITMPGMQMPSNTIQCRELSPGYYQGVGTFTMSGVWTITATATLPNGQHAQTSRTAQIQ
jgi:hypothetical protein